MVLSESIKLLSSFVFSEQFIKGLYDWMLNNHHQKHVNIISIWSKQRLLCLTSAGDASDWVIFRERDLERLEISEHDWISFNSFFFILFVTIIQSITSSEMCSLYLTHPSAHTHTTHTHTPGAVDTHTPGAVGGSVPCSRVSVVNNSCRSRDANPQPRVTSPTLCPLEPRLSNSGELVWTLQTQAVHCQCE